MKHQPAASKRQRSSPNAEMNACRSVLGDRLRRSRANLGRVVADIVIAGQITARHGQGVVQDPGKFQVVRLRRGVEGEVAAVDDEVGAGRVDIFADVLEIRG